MRATMGAAPSAFFGEELLPPAFARVLVTLAGTLFGAHGLGVAQLGRRLVEGFHSITVRPAGGEVKRWAGGD